MYMMSMRDTAMYVPYSCRLMALKTEVRIILTDMRMVEDYLDECRVTDRVSFENGQQPFVANV